MDLADVATLKGLLAKHGLQGALKALGQHFLISRPVVDQIIDASRGAASYLEIGPGPGVLTSRLSDLAPTVALELDERMPEVLAESAPQARVLREDALKVDLASILHEMPEPRVLVSNLPYYITGPLLGRIEEVRGCLRGAVLMMQREVGEKILAQPGNRDRGALSVCLQRAFAIRKVCDVPKGAFLPPPKVESVVLELMSRPEDPDPGWNRFVHAGFRMPRKTLMNNLAGLGGRELSEQWLLRAGIDGSRRAQTLTEDEWITLYRVTKPS